jgi:hypothetical protein
VREPTGECYRCFIERQERQISELDDVIQALFRVADPSHDAKKFGAWKALWKKYRKDPWEHAAKESR